MKTVLKISAISMAMLLINTWPASNLAKAQSTPETYVKIVVDGLSCPFCAYGLEKKLKRVAGSKEVFIELEAGYATMRFKKGEEPSKKDFETIVKDAGFVPKEITFSDKPFKTKKNE